MRTRAPRLVFFTLVCLSGCTIVGMRNDLQQGQTRIDAKQQQLNDLRTTQTELAAESGRLQDDLQQRELNASELHARLDELVKLNEAAQAAAAQASAQERAQREERRRQLQAVSQQAQALDQDTSLSAEDKQNKLDALKEKTRGLLQLLLAG